jgi:uncharacterized membrane protein
LQGGEGGGARSYAAVLGLVLEQAGPALLGEQAIRLYIKKGRRMNLFQGREAHGRSFAKAVSWRITGSIDTFINSFFVTGKISLAGTIAAVEVVTKIVIYYLHECVWAAIPWGHHSA